MKQVSDKRAKINRARAVLVKRLLDERPICEAQISGCTQLSTDCHEILTRARGGSILDEENIVCLCRSCHSFITENPAWSAEHGFMLHSWSTTADAQAALRARLLWVYGDDD